MTVVVNYLDILSKWMGQPCPPENSHMISLVRVGAASQFAEHRHTLQTELLDQVIGLPPEAHTNLMDHVLLQTQINVVIAAFMPAPSEDKGATMVSLWESNEKKDKGIRLRMRPNKAFKRIFPWLSDPYISVLGDWYREHMLLKDDTLTLHTSTDRKDFGKAYGGENAKMANPGCTRSRKSLAFSCMQYKTSNFSTPCHPAEAYGSGEFTIVWVETSDGLIAGRCTVWTRPKSERNLPLVVAAPVYGVSDAAIDMIEVKVAEMESEYPEVEWYNGWEGAKLLKIEDGGKFVGPYFDVEPRSVRDEGTHFIASSNGSLSAEQTSGYFDRDCTCYNCGDHIEDGDGYERDDGDTYCSYCYEDLGRMECERCEDRVHENSVVSVIVYRLSEETWCESCADNHSAVCDSTGDRYHDELLMDTADGLQICQSAYEDSWFTCVLSDEIYHVDDGGTLAGDSGCASIEYMKSDGNYKENDDGEWESIQSELTRTA